MAAGAGAESAAAACAALLDALRDASVTSQAGRLPALYAGLVASAAALAAFEAAGPVVAMLRQRQGGEDLVGRTLGALQSALVPDSAPAWQLAALEALRSALQDAQAEAASAAAAVVAGEGLQQPLAKVRPPRGAAVLAARAVGALAPAVAALVHAGTRRPVAALEGERLAAVVGGLKVRPG